ncbi:S8 family serine peptidase [Pseudoxanthomonas winnipegensis]|uniref:S8 family peptidase n=1 Tax=Pseudoxanthomonas winnipegensis TaxID=2480810 RepID=UPI0025762D11|nr:S8 family serine peptidase [Pseudoxanthomonas winnipegensis]WJI14581.1 S8 family serine peptidase [Pseudoxanthomonas winnipegensis]
MSLSRPVLSLSVCAVLGAMGAFSTAHAAARLDAQLQSKIASAAADAPLQVVITYKQSTAPTASQLADLKALGITEGVSMRKLPIAGAVATPAEIKALAARDDVASIYYNAPLKYYDAEAREITGVERAYDNPGDFGRALPYSGRGVGVMINDSGIDGTNSDVAYGTHVVQNVLANTNLATFDSMLPITYVENVPNTDLGSGHGTHCAGIVGGTGGHSNGVYRGAAPGASLVGYGSGAVLLILDAVGGLDYALVNQFSFKDPIRVVSNSWGTSGKFDPTDPVTVSTYELYKHGIVSVFAAGNDGPSEDTHNPYAQAPWVISVAAGEKDGVLTSFSSRGKRGESGTFTMADGKQWTYFNEPTITAPGVDIISTRALTGALPPLAAQEDVATLSPAQLPFYTVMSGTSMATPHVAGIIALMLEANPDLTPAQVKDILERTATNIPGRAYWEAGAGYVNAYDALQEAAKLRSGYGSTVNSLKTFNSNALLSPGSSQPFEVLFTPVGEPQYQTFEVGDNVAWVSASATMTGPTAALVLTDPDGERYGSSIALPVLGSTVKASAPGKKGTWKISVSGIGSIGGVAVDPLRVTNGVSAPGVVSGTIEFINSAGFSGLKDVPTSSAYRGAVEYAVSNRLMDGSSNGNFRPSDALTRAELAQYLVMGAGIRQSLPAPGKVSFTGLSTKDPSYAAAEAVVAKGAVLRDLSQSQAGVMGLVNGNFKPADKVTKLQLAYSLVQSLGLQDTAVNFNGTLSVTYNGKQLPIEDVGSIPASLRGYVQSALDNGILNARYTVTQGATDLQPTLHAYFDPTSLVTRGAYAVTAGRFLDVNRQAEN